MQLLNRCRQRWFVFVGAMLLLFSAACGAPNAPQSTAASTFPAASSSLAAPSSAASSAAPTTDGTAPVPEAATEAAATVAAESAVTPEAVTAAPTATVTATATQAALAPFDPALAAQLQQILDDTVANGAIPGASLAVFVPGQETWLGASGLADRRNAVPFDPRTKLRIASISKMFTSVVVLQLVDEGRINLDAPLATYLPDLVSNGDAIAIRNLLQHTSGLYDFLEDRNFVAQAYQNPDRRFEPSELVAYANRFRAAFAPGTEGAWDYSSTNFVILGMVAEQVTGNSLAQEMRARIFTPLALESTYFAPDEEIPAPTARGYGQSTDQTNVAMSFAYGTANLVSTPENVQRFIRALAGGELLRPETLDQMFTFINGKGQYNMPELEYGLGIMRNRLPVGESVNGQARAPEASRVVGHIGGFGGFRSAVWTNLDSGITIALGVNQASTDPNTLATRVFEAILTQQGQ